MPKPKDKAKRSFIENVAKEFGGKVAEDPTRKQKELLFARDDMKFKKQPMSSLNIRAKEEELVSAIDDLRALRSLAPMAIKLLAGKLSVAQALNKVGPESLVTLMKLAFSESTSEKVRADVLKHMLALNGHSPTQKHQIERLVDENTSKEALLAIISGAAKDLKSSGLELIDDRKTREDKDAITKRVEKIDGEVAKRREKLADEDDESYDYRKYEAEPGSTEQS